MVSSLHDDRSSAADARSADGEPTVLVGRPATHAPPPVALPPRLGRYVVVEEIGAGGMGRVLRAYDPKLRREVALKVLGRAAHQESEGAARIVREAQAMARLSHPNLVPIYDVELDRDASGQPTVFIAMEYVEGDTLRKWLAVERRPWPEIVAAFGAAGRGLAAAHEAGVVHRDFKPTNAMVGADGRVRVMDFGLARGVAAVDSDAESVDDFDLHGAALSSELTEAGTVIGTPPYMAPEQHRGAAVVPASDQYAFCVALYEALHGVRPFQGADISSLLRAKLRGVPEAPVDATRRVPRWLNAAVVRGLAVDPAARWPTMAALLAVLERGQSRTRLRRALTGVAALGLAGAAVALVQRLDVHHRTAACEQSGADIAEVWNDDVRAQLSAALRATGVSHAATTVDKVMPWLDRQSAAWQHARTESCLDHDVRDVWDRPMLDRSLWCLDERRMELEALVGELMRADATVVPKAVTAAAGLPSVEPCRDAGLLGRLPAPPFDRREEFRAVRAELSRVDALARAGRYREGLELVRSTREAVEQLDWPPLSAAARVREATLLEREGDFDRAAQVGVQAYFEAASVAAWDVAAFTASWLVFVVGERLARHADALTWGHHAELALGHAGDPEGLREANRLAYLAMVHYRMGDYEQATTLHERALAIKANVIGADHPDLATNMVSLAHVLFDTNELTRARELYQRSLDIWEAALGPDHPSIAISLNGLALVHYSTGEYAQARATYERALAIWEATLGPEHPDLAAPLNNLGLVHYATGDYALARPLYERTLAIQQKVLGPEHPDIAASYSNLGNVASAMGQHAEARALHERALAIRERALGPDHMEVAMSLNNLGIEHLATGDRARARALYERALAIKEKALGADHPGVATTLVGLAQVQAEGGDDREAARILERAVAIYDRHDGEQENELAARFALAKALVASGGDRGRARELAERARDGWRAGGDTERKELAEVEAWLRED